MSDLTEEDKKLIKENYWRIVSEIHELTKEDVRKEYERLHKFQTHIHKEYLDFAGFNKSLAICMKEILENQDLIITMMRNLSEIHNQIEKRFL